LGGGKVASHVMLHTSSEMINNLLIRLKLPCWRGQAVLRTITDL
jgi:hypothetical protein